MVINTSNQKIIQKKGIHILSKFLAQYTCVCMFQKNMTTMHKYKVFHTVHTPYYYY